MREVTERQLSLAEQRLQGVERAVAALPNRAESLARVAVRARQLTPQEQVEVQRMLAPSQRQALIHACRAADRLLPEQFRELAQWGSSPVQRARSATVKLFTRAIHDHDLERGMG